MIRLAFYNPEIPQNTGTLMRLSACLGVPFDIIEPCGFVLSDRRMQRAGMDYIELSNYKRHVNWDVYSSEYFETHRPILLTPTADAVFTDFKFDKNDILILGKESSGFPEEVESQCPYKVKIPMQQGVRSLNVAVAGAMVLSEALRQTDGFKQ